MHLCTASNYDLGLFWPLSPYVITRSPCWESRARPRVPAQCVWSIWSPIRRRRSTQHGQESTDRPTDHSVSCIMAAIMARKVLTPDTVTQRTITCYRKSPTSTVDVFLWSRRRSPHCVVPGPHAGVFYYVRCWPYAPTIQFLFFLFVFLVASLKAKLHTVMLCLCLNCFVLWLGCHKCCRFSTSSM